MTRGWQTQGRSRGDRRRKKTRPQRPTGPVQRPLTEERPQAPQTSRQVTSGVGWRSAPASRVATSISLRPEDYHYIYSDLRRIAVLAAAIFAVLIILSFIIK